MKTPHLLLGALSALAFGGLAQASPPGHRPLPRPIVRPPVQVRPSPIRPPAFRPLPGRRIVIRQPISSSPHEARALQVLRAVYQDGSCERLGESLRRLSNAILSSASQANRPDSDLIPGDRRSELRLRHRREWRETLKTRLFWETVFEQLADAYRSCDTPCLEDGEAIGQIAGTMYCSASMGLDGLDAPGFLAQNPVPVCGTSIRVGCQQAFRSTALSYEGCAAYTEGGFVQTFLESISQDCFVEGS